MRKLTIIEVKEVFEQQGYKLLTEEYIDNKQKLRVICPNGHTILMRLDSFKSGRRCPCCKPKNKHTIEFIRTQVESVGYTLLSTEYINSSTPLDMMCNEGHVFKLRWNDFQQGHRCTVHNKRTYEDVKELIESEGHTLISTTYRNNKTPLEIMCPHGHINHTTVNAWVSMHGKYHCFQCSVDASRKTIDQVRQDIWNEARYTLISTEYKNSTSKILVQCDKGHIYPVTYNAFMGGNRCPKCPKEHGTSKQEKSLIEFIKSIYTGTIITNDKTQLQNPSTGYFLELDIWLPELNKAIEYNGNYWHSLPERQRYDELKKHLCEEKSIKLLVVDNVEWTYKCNKNKCIEKIRSYICE